MIATKGRPHFTRSQYCHPNQLFLPIENGNNFYASSWLEGWSQEAEKSHAFNGKQPD